jgi:hypothetical protein
VRGGALNKLFFFFLIISLFTFPESGHAKQLYEWKNCSNDDDCIMIDDGCSAAMSINKNLIHEYEIFRDETTPYIECMPPSPNDPNAIAFCSNNECDFSIKN